MPHLPYRVQTDGRVSQDQESEPLTYDRGFLCVIAIVRIEDTVRLTDDE